MRMRILAVAGVLLVLPSLASAQRWGRERFPQSGACFFQDRDFRGDYFCVPAGASIPVIPDDMNDEISSIRIFGRARVVVFDQREFSGESEEFTADVADLTLRHLGGSRTWNDRIDSFQVESGGGGRGRGGWGRGTPRNRDNPFGRDGGVCVYEFADFRGRSECWEAGEDESNLNRLEGWNDRISSIRVYGRARARIYRDANFRGGHLEVMRDIRNLGEVSWDDQISSIEVR